MPTFPVQIEMFYSSAVVKSAETFDAATTGILDCDMTGGAYQTGKNPAFQFAGDLMGGYQNPYQQMAWLLHGAPFASAQILVEVVITALLLFAASRAPADQ